MTVEDQDGPGSTPDSRREANAKPESAVAAAVTPERTMALPGHAEGVGRARRFVRQRLEEAGRPEWVDAATLAVSELVTNSVLHAHTDVQVTVRVNHDHVRIEVCDGGSTLPMPRSYDRSAVTGRGLELVAAVSFDHGVKSLGKAGKNVWCCVSSDSAQGLGGPQREDDRWVASLAEFGAAVHATARSVWLLGMPLLLWSAAREHHDALLREVALVQASLSGAAAADSARNLTAADIARRRIGDAVVAAIGGDRAIAVPSLSLPADGAPTFALVPTTVDIEVLVSPGEVELFVRLQDLLDHAERLAGEDQLLARPGLPEILAVRDWACEQIIAQVEGAPPVPWTGVDDARFAAADSTGPSTNWLDISVTHAATGKMAVDEANRIVAVSGRLARLLGWEPEDLKGRRVVAIVPARLREAHVAGFSRYLSTGAGRALDTTLRLPVLCADGGEVDCSLLIHAECASSGKAVFVADIEPLHEPTEEQSESR